MAARVVEEVDAVVIGAGQGGTPLAMALADAGMRTVLVERDRVGGTCVLRGCTPSKTMIASARVAAVARSADEFGIRTGSVGTDMAAVRERKRKIVDGWSESLRRRLLGKEGLELVDGDARFIGERTLEVKLQDGGARRMRAARVFVDTGSRPTVPPIEGLADVPFLDSTSVMDLGEVPRHLLVVGGGFVGLEFAQMFRRFGARVSVLDRGPFLAPREDEDVSDALREILEEDGIEVRTNVSVRTASRADPGGRGESRERAQPGESRDPGESGESAVRGVRLELEGPGGTDVVSGSHLLLAVGRVPNTEGLGLEATGLTTDDRGYLPVNGRRETAVGGIWALGDVTGAPPFTHYSYDDFRIIRDNLLGRGGADAAHRTPVYTLFTDPQLGRVGLTEGEARERGMDIRVARLPMKRVARALETGETRGFMKAVVERGSGKIVGAAVLGSEGGELAGLLQVAMMGDLRYEALREANFSHPTLAESLNNLFAELDP